MRVWIDRLVLGPRRRRRQVDRLLVDLGLAPGTASAPRATGHGRTDGAGRARRTKTRRGSRRPSGGTRNRARGAITVATAGALTLLAVPVATEQLTGWDLGIGPDWDTGVADPFGSHAEPRPPAGVDAAASPLGRPPSVDGRGGFAFLHVDDGGPVAPDPCRALRLVVSGRAPVASAGVVEDAAAVLSEATGLQISVEGSTDEQPTERRAPFQPDRYGARWAPVLVAWTDPGRVPGLEGTVAGLAGPAVRTARDGQQMIVSGDASLDRPQLERIGRSPGGYAAARSVVVHELAHVLGLGHVDDPGSLMNPQATAHVLNDGDRRGLAALGRGPCVPSL